MTHLRKKSSIMRIFKKRNKENKVVKSTGQVPKNPNILQEELEIQLFQPAEELKNPIILQEKTETTKESHNMNEEVQLTKGESKNPNNPQGESESHKMDEE